MNNKNEGLIETNFSFPSQKKIRIKAKYAIFMNLTI